MPSFRRVASLDLGSNSSLLWIGDVSASGTLHTRLDLARITGLGRGLYRGLPLRSDARARVLEALEEYRPLLEQQGVEEVFAVGTAAWREASDGPRFAEEAGAVLGCTIEVVSGEREAQLTWLGVSGDYGRDSALAVCDPGGRSTELMWGIGAELIGLTSIYNGTLNSTTQYLLTDPPSTAEVQALFAELRERLSWLPIPDEYPHTLIGVSATAISYGSMALELSSWAPDRVEGYRLTRAVLDALVLRLASLDLAARMDVPGLDPLRADSIVAGGVILQACLEAVKSDALVVSSLGLRHGRVREAFQNGTLSF